MIRRGRATVRGNSSGGAAGSSLGAGGGPGEGGAEAEDEDVVCEEPREDDVQGSPYSQCYLAADASTYKFQVDFRALRVARAMRQVLL